MRGLLLSLKRPWKLSSSAGLFVWTSLPPFLMSSAEFSTDHWNCLAHRMKLSQEQRSTYNVVGNRMLRPSNTVPQSHPQDSTAGSVSHRGSENRRDVED